VETQYRYQFDIPGAVVVMYDPLASSHGSLSLKAFRLTASFMKLYKKRKFTKESLAEENFSFQDIFKEVPVYLNSSSLGKAFLNYLELDDQATDQFESFDLSSDDFMEKNLDLLVDCIAELQKEQNAHTAWYRNLIRTEQSQQQFLKKRKEENQLRIERKEEPLPETPEQLELENPLFKKIPEPSCLESLLVSNRISNHCKQILQFSGQTLTKQFLTKSLDDANKI